jgi:hypothetical protein
MSEDKSNAPKTSLGTKILVGFVLLLLVILVVNIIDMNVRGAHQAEMDRLDNIREEIRRGN